MLETFGSAYSLQITTPYHSLRLSCEMAFAKLPQGQDAITDTIITKEEEREMVVNLFNNHDDDIDNIKAHAQKLYKKKHQSEVKTGEEFSSDTTCTNFKSISYSSINDYGIENPQSPTSSLCSTNSSTSTLQNMQEKSKSLPSLLDSGTCSGIGCMSLQLTECVPNPNAHNLLCNDVLQCSNRTQHDTESDMDDGSKTLVRSQGAVTGTQQSCNHYDHLNHDQSLTENQTTMSGDHCMQNQLNDDQQNQSAKLLALHSNSDSAIGLDVDYDVSVNVCQTNGNLSRVLEVIPPMVYIPNTKQLLSIKQTLPHTLANDWEGIESGSTTSVNTHGEGNLPCSPCSQVSPGTNSVAEGTPLLVIETDSNHGNTIIEEDSQDCEPILDLEKTFIEAMAVHVETDSAFEPSPHNSLKRTNTSGSLSRTDASSFSSISSISSHTDFSINASISDEYNLELRSSGYGLDNENGPFMEVSLHSRNSYEHTVDPTEEEATQIKGANKPKRKGITSFFTRGLFSRKPKATEVQGWRLFGKVPPKSVPTKDPQQITDEYQARAKLRDQEIAGKKNNVEVTSTTALILHNRPKNLPSKSPEEELRHKQQYATMIEAAKKREVKEAKQKRKQLQQQLKVEEKLSLSVKCWNQDILPKWDAMVNSKKTRELWWHGIPPCVRGKVWQRAIGNDLNITHELYEICLNRAKDKIKVMADNANFEQSSEMDINKEDSVELIKLDVSRTFPQLCIFQKGGPYYDLLHNLLGAYACYRPDVGYVQGMSFIAAVLLLNLDQADAFICFANLLNKPCQVAFFRVDESIMGAYFDTFEDFLKENLPKVYHHFHENEVIPHIYIIDWIFTLFSKSLPLDVASRVWDVFCRDGEEFLFQTALGILKVYEDILIHMDFIYLAQFLTKLPEDICADELFRSIDSIQMSIDKRKFSQVLTMHKDKLKDTRDTGSLRSFKDTSSIRSLVTSQAVL